MASLPVNLNQLQKQKGKSGDKPARPFIKPDYSSIKHPSTIKLISVVKNPQPQPVDDMCVGLTKGELMPYISDPFWQRIRMVMVSLFGIIFFGMLFGAATIITLTPPCELLLDNTTHVLQNISYNGSI